MRILVCGSRKWKDDSRIYYTLRALDVPDDERQDVDPVVVVHGGAWGADRMAGDAAMRLGMRVEVYPADWNVHGKRAGILRNLEMLNSGIDRVIAFRCDGESRGTDHTIAEARKRGLPVEVVVP